MRMKCHVVARQTCCGVCCALLMAVTSLLASADDLLDGFRSPPRAARPQVWWHWMNGNVTKEGITADLEAMARVGIGGAFVFDVSDSIPEGPVGFATDEWMEMLRHADAEARRLGLALGLSNCSGWSSSGGPWVAPADSMKSVVWTETRVAGGTRFSGKLPSLPNAHGFCRDIAVLAVPRPAAESINPVDYGMDAKATFAAKPNDKRVEAMRKCLDIPHGCNLRKPKKGGKPNVATFTFERPFPLSGLLCSLASPERHEKIFAVVEVSEDGKTFRQVGRQKIHLSIYGDHDDKDTFIPCPSAGARAVRVTFEFNKPEVWHKLWHLRPTAAAGIPELKAKSFSIRSEARYTPYETRADQVVPKSGIIDLTSKVGSDGMLEWDAPSGDWLVFRFGYAANGHYPRPTTRLGAGLEVDKLSAAAVERCFNAYVGKAADMFGPKKPFPECGFNNVLVDSYEVGPQNWTDGFEKTFRARMGYDIVPYLPILTGCVVDGKDDTERVLSDFRRVVSDLFIDSYAKTFARLCHERGLYFSLEGYGSAPCDDAKYARWSDFTMGEFWSGDMKDPLRIGNVRFGASIAHVWGGGRIVSAESFTSGKETRWLKDPFAMKAQNDRVWCAGVNQIIYHSYPHQPWMSPAVWPGMTMGMHGTHYGRTLTWWEQSGEWHRYQARAQFLLQQGVVAADVLVYNGDDAPNCGLELERWHSYARASPVPPPYAWDVCGGDAVAELRVENGRIVAPSGARYSIMSLPRGGEGLSAESRADVERLRRAGAHVVDGKPDSAVMSRMGIVPDVTAGDLKLAFIHRIAKDGSDIYFLALPNKAPVSFEASFRVTGRTPELWNPETGECSRCIGFRETNGRTVVPLSFEPSGSMFVVFRPAPTPGLPLARVWRKSGEAAVEGPWRVAFVDGRGAPEKLDFDKIVSWTERPEQDVRYYSGSAIYAKTVNVPAGERIVLDLGDVKNLVDVTVNGKTYPTLWKPPFRVDITDAVKGRPTAELSLKVTNLWPNRLIGDDALPPDTKYIKGRDALKAIPEWVWAGKPSPTGRHTFATWRHWRKNEPLLPSGLIGPVRLETGTFTEKE